MLDLVCRRYGVLPSQRLGFEMMDPMGYALDAWIACKADAGQWDSPIRALLVEYKK